MPRAAKGPPHIKRIARKGKVYLYFRTGVMKPEGGEIMRPLPDPKDPSFGAVYGALLAARSRRAQVQEETLKLPHLIRLYENSEEFRKLSAGSQKTYGVYLRRLALEFNEAPANAIEPQDVYALIDEMGKPQAGNMIVTVLRNIYRWGRKRKHVTVDPCAEIEFAEGGEYEPWPEWLIDEALACDDPLIRQPVALLYFTAQRLGDVCALRWSDVRDDAIHLTQQKTRKEMEIPIHPDLSPILAGATKRGLTILADEKGRKAKDSTVRQRLQRWAAERGQKIVPHGLRKNAVNSLLEAGCSVAETSAISGQSLQLVEHYAKRRNTRKLGKAAVLKWAGTNRGRATVGKTIDENRRKT